MSTDFSSVDRLMEIGLSMGLAQQMINTMNYTMNNMQIAGVNANSTQCRPLNNNLGAQWYAVVNNLQAGPINEEELKLMISREIVTNDTLLWCAGMNAWQHACDIPSVNKLLLLK